MSHALAIDTARTVLPPVRVEAGPFDGFVAVVAEQPFWASMRPLRVAVAQATPGECVAYAVALDTRLIARLMTLVTFRLQRRRAERAITRGGGRVVASYGLDPSLAKPTCLYEMNSPASAYADRCLRPRGSAPGLRWLISRCFGCDPALGGVLIVGRKMTW